jgi:2-polyprenyl-6-methoxyphenol hydroxylase-like FAD-dependent oxidoreductase
MIIGASHPSLCPDSQATSGSEDIRSRKRNAKIRAKNSIRSEDRWQAKKEGDHMRVLVVGAGIGGLAAAVALRKIGIETLVIERAASIREVGAGLSIWSNAVNALRELGLEDKVMASASAIDRNVVQSSKGRFIARTELSELTNMAGAPCVCIHRGVLQKTLLDALPRDSVRSGARCAGFEGSTAILESGERIEADVLVGADGISSVIREGLHGAETTRYAGYTCWRGIRDGIPGLLPENSALLVLGGGSQFGAWPCGSGKLYWFLTKNAPRGTVQTKTASIAVCRDWTAPVPEIVAGTSENAILQNDIIDRPPLRWWGRGAVTLLGDAAHPTTPNLGQGACLALEDAVVLAHCLGEPRPIDASLRKYEDIRLPRTTEIVRNSWQAGRVIQIESPALMWLRDWFMGTPVGALLEMRTFKGLLTYKLPRLRSSQPGIQQHPESVGVEGR